MVLPFCASRFLLPVTELTRYETLVETVYSSFESRIFGVCGVCGAATRFDFDDPKASGSMDFPFLTCAVFGSLAGSLDGSEIVFGSPLGSGSLDGSFDGSGSLEGSGLLDGSFVGSGSLDGSFVGSLEGSETVVGSPLGSGSLDGSLEASGSLEGSPPSSCNNGNFLHSAVNFFGLHPKPTHDVPFTTSTISISFCSFNILQWILKSGVSVFVV